MTSSDNSLPPKHASSSIASLRRWAPVVIVAVLAVIVLANGWHRLLSLEALAENRNALQGLVVQHYALAIAGYMAVYAVAVALSLPGGLALTLSGGLLFGWLIGGMAAVVAATVGATIVFAVARSAVGEHLAAKAGPWLERLREGFKADALSYLLFLRLVPAFPFWLVNLAPALLGVRTSTYVVGTLFGIIPGTLAFASIGAGLDSVIAVAQAEQAACIAAKSAAPCPLAINATALVNKQLLIAFVLLGLVALIPVALRRMGIRFTPPA